MRNFTIEYGYEDGVLVGYCPETGDRDGVHLSSHARDLARRGAVRAEGDLYAYLDSLGGPPESAGKIAQKIKKGIKKVGKTVVKSAKKIVKSKLVKGIYNTIKKVIPQPFKAGLTVAQAGVKFAKKAAKKGSKHRKAVPTVKKLAAGKITPQQAESEAEALGVDPEEVKAAAVTVKMKEAADAGDEKARTVVEAVEKIEGANDGEEGIATAVAFGAEAKLRAQFPSAQVMRVVQPDGRTSLTAVIPL